MSTDYGLSWLRRYTPKVMSSVYQAQDNYCQQLISWCQQVIAQQSPLSIEKTRFFIAQKHGGPEMDLITEVDFSMKSTAYFN